MKNLRKIKLALTVGLINKSSGQNLLNSIKELMKSFTDEVGSFIELTTTKHIPLNAALTNQSYAIRYENAVLNVDVVTNRNTNSQYIQGFNLK